MPRPRPEPPYTFVCDRDPGHTITLHNRETSLGARPCMQPGCTGWLRLQPPTTPPPGTAVRPLEPQDAILVEALRSVAAASFPDRARDAEQLLLEAIEELHERRARLTELEAQNAVLLGIVRPLYEFAVWAQECVPETTLDHFGDVSPAITRAETLLRARGGADTGRK